MGYELLDVQEHEDLNLSSPLRIFLVALEQEQHWPLTHK